MRQQNRLLLCFYVNCLGCKFASSKIKVLQGKKKKTISPKCYWLISKEDGQGNIFCHFSKNLDMWLFSNVLTLNTRTQTQERSVFIICLTMTSLHECCGKVDTVYYRKQIRHFFFVVATQKAKIWVYFEIWEIYTYIYMHICVCVCV